MASRLALLMCLLIGQAGCEARDKQEGTPEHPFDPAAFFPITPGTVWKYKVTISKDVTPLTYEMVSCPTDTGTLWVERRSFVHPPRTERAGEAGESEYRLQFRVDGPALMLPDGENISQGVEVAIEQDDLGLFKNVQNMIWQWETGQSKEFKVRQTCIQQDSREIENARGTPLVSQLVFFSFAQPLHARVSSSNVELACMPFSTNDLQSKSVESIGIVRAVGPRARTGDPNDPKESNPKLVKEDEQLLQGFIETATYARGKGLVKMVQMIGDKVAMTWTLEDYQPGDAQSVSAVAENGGTLRFDGIYRGDPTRFDGRTAYTYFRFDADGNVYSTCTTSPAQDVVGLNSQNANCGRYAMQGSALQFACGVPRSSSMRYEGFIKNDALVLNASSDKGYRSLNRYEFVGVDITKASARPAQTTSRGVYAPIEIGGTFYDVRAGLARLALHLREVKAPAVSVVWSMTPGRQISMLDEKGNHYRMITGWECNFEDTRGDMKQASFDSLGRIEIQEGARMSELRGIRPEEIQVDYRDAVSIILSRGGRARHEGLAALMTCQEIRGKGVRPVWVGSGWYLPAVADRVAIDVETGELYPNDEAVATTKQRSPPALSSREWKGTEAARTTAIQPYNPKARRYELDRPRVREAMSQLAKLPQNDNIRYQCGVLCAVLGEWVQAVDYFTLVLNGQDLNEAQLAHVRQIRGLTYLAIRDLESAERDLKAARPNSRLQVGILETLRAVRSNSPPGLHEKGRLFTEETVLGDLAMEIWLGWVCLDVPQPAVAPSETADMLAVSGIVEFRETSATPISKGAPDRTPKPQVRYGLSVRLTNRSKDKIRLDKITISAAVTGNAPEENNIVQMLIPNGIRVGDMKSELERLGTQYTIAPGEHQLLSHSIELDPANLAFDGPQLLRLELKRSGMPDLVYEADLPPIHELTNAAGRAKEILLLRVE